AWNCPTPTCRPPAPPAPASCASSAPPSNAPIPHASGARRRRRRGPTGTSCCPHRPWRASRPTCAGCTATSCASCPATAPPPPERRRDLAYVVAQTGPGLGGDGDVLARALVLALGQALAGRGYDVQYSFAGPALSDPRPLRKPGEVARVLYHREENRVDAGGV